MRPADHDRSDAGALPRAPLTSEQKSILKAETYSRLLDLAEKTGDQGYARAARALWQTSSGGRPPIDDSAAIAEVEFLFSTGKAKTLNQALMIVARGRVPVNQQHSYAKRLHRKILAKKLPQNRFSESGAPA